MNATAATSTTAGTVTSADATAITAVLDRLTAAWNAGDGAAYGAEFTADATYITYVGTLYQGADEIGHAHQVLFDSFVKGTKLASETQSIRMTGPDSALVVTRGATHMTGPDSALVVTRGATHKGDRPAKLDKIQTYTLVRGADGAWKVAAFQNTKRKPLMEAISFRFQPASKPADQPADRPAA
ncbi:SgcJ/EcaC family oxidoreductase [Actinomadura logoneensis]|uniref:SgcJ/EcaC family oxidoreductase n=1 Tax=Actinomadura logoneensis TaxID=2293572 RepID=A0A372JTW9_9ACTN|nr:SgcJ/EcaC family oxidoreductase [Actinomadura logoneensis]RFU43389.1 SgcJ/EcaC family oxidoreductase [Actinomadura logoneensis]